LYILEADAENGALQVVKITGIEPPAVTGLGINFGDLTEQSYAFSRCSVDGYIKNFYAISYYAGDFVNGYETKLFTSTPTSVAAPIGIFPTGVDYNAFALNQSTSNTRSLFVLPVHWYESEGSQLEMIVNDINGPDPDSIAIISVDIPHISGYNGIGVSTYYGISSNYPQPSTFVANFSANVSNLSPYVYFTESGNFVTGQVQDNYDRIMCDEKYFYLINNSKTEVRSTVTGELLNTIDNVYNGELDIRTRISVSPNDSELVTNGKFYEIPQPGSYLVGFNYCNYGVNDYENYND
jgi:hypothetical protein